MAKLATRKSWSISSPSDRNEAIKTSSGSMNESRHTNSHRGICIYSSSMHNMARNWAKKGRNELKRLKVSVLCLWGIWCACPYTQPGPKWAPCVWSDAPRWSMPEPSLCGRRAALRLQNRHQAVFNLNPQHRIFQWLWCWWKQKAEHQFLLGPSSTGDPPRARHSSLSQAAGTGSQLSADTDYPINLNLILLYPTYTQRLFCSHLNANVVNITLRDVLDRCVASGEEWALLRCDTSHPEELFLRE